MTRQPDTATSPRPAATARSRAIRLRAYVSAATVLALATHAMAGTVRIDTLSSTQSYSLSSQPFTTSEQRNYGAGETTVGARFGSATEIGSSTSMQYLVTGFSQLGGPLAFCDIAVYDTLTFSAPTGASFVEFDIYADGVISPLPSGTTLTAYSHLSLHLDDALTGVALFAHADTVHRDSSSQSGAASLHLRARVPVVQSMTMRWGLYTELGFSQVNGILPGGSFTLVNDFLSTANFGPLQFTDSVGNVVSGGGVTSSSGALYAVGPAVVPLPTSLSMGVGLLLSASIAAIVAGRRSRMLELT